MMIKQAYAAVMAAKNRKGAKSAFHPATLNQHFQMEELRKRVYTSFLTQAQLIVAESDARARENVDHLMNVVLCPRRGYGTPAFSLTDISRDIEQYFTVYGKHCEKKVGFFLIGGWIFIQHTGFPLVVEKLIAGSSVGATQAEAVERFLKRFDASMSMQHSFRLGHALHARGILLQELMEQYVFQTPCSTYH